MLFEFGYDELVNILAGRCSSEVLSLYIQIPSSVLLSAPREVMVGVLLKDMLDTPS